MFQIGHVSLTSADTYRRDSYRLARVFQNLPAPPKQYGVIDVFRDFQGFSKSWVALGKFLEEFVYLAVKICQRDTLPSATPSFQVGKNFENREKHQRRRIAWVGQADFGKLELNNRNHGGKCQRLSAKRDQFETRSI